MRLTRASIGHMRTEKITTPEKKKNVSFVDSLSSEDEIETPSPPITRRKKRASRRKKDLSDNVLSSSATSDEGVCDLGLLAPPSIPNKILRPRHKLQHSWTFWFFRNTRTLSWEQNQTKMATVETIEDFWMMINSLQPASQLPNGCDYSVFRSGIFPDWEDFQNMLGGRWIVRDQDKTKMDSNWLELLFLLVGEHAEDQAGLINGAVVNVRNKGNKLAVWLRDSRDMGCVVTVGRMLKSRLGLGANVKIQFSVHMEERERVKVRGVGMLPEISL